MIKKINDKNMKILSGVIVAVVIIVAVTAYYIGLNKARSSNRSDEKNIFQIQNDYSNGSKRMRGENGLMNGGGMMRDAVTISKEGELTSSDLEALHAALVDELKAFTFYTNIIAKFGDVRPFVMIVQSEAQHISRLHAIYEAYGVAIPSITPEVVSAPNTLQEACAIGVQAEIDNAALYSELMAKTEKQSIQSVFTALSSASTNNHKVAFERCSGN